ncbi:MAG: TetR/AcrR family transcriptional regulator [Clostridia bacterium]|nr:TetR/AcrR family transcriptional regulator [Clostridia bacterium]
MPFQERRTSTRIEIIRYACKLIIEEGFSKTSASRIAKELNLSPGNITFYFPSKEHLLAVLVEELCAFQHQLMVKETNEGYSSLLAYCLEIMSIATICAQNDVARELYIASYTHQSTLQIIREHDLNKTKQVFGEFCPNWSESKWREMENLVSGIEYGTIMTRETDTPLELQIESTLDAIMTLYNVPSDLRRQKIDKVLAMDYRKISNSILQQFKHYVEDTHESAFQKQMQSHPHNRWKEGN